MLEGSCELPSTHFKYPGIDFVWSTGFVYLEPGELPLNLGGGEGGGWGVQWVVGFCSVMEILGLGGLGGEAEVTTFMMGGAGFTAEV